MFQADRCRAQMFDPAMYYGSDPSVYAGMGDAGGAYGPEMMGGVPCDPAAMGGGAGPGVSSGGYGAFDNVGCRPALVWGRADYMLMWTKDRTVPVMLTTSPQGTPLADAGVLGQAGTQILLGGADKLDPGSQPGFAIESGLWFSRNQGLGMGFRWVQIEDDFVGANLNSEGNPILARPFYNVNTNEQASLLVAYPGVSQGSIVTGDELSLKMGDAFLRKLLYTGGGNRVDLIGGYQYGDLDDRVFAQQNLLSLDPNGRVPVGTTINSLDNFTVQNRFDGGSVGLITECEDGRWLWRGLTKVAFGNVNQLATISGSTTTTIPNGPSATSSQGLLALPTNIGQYERDEFCILPELHLSATYRLTCSIGLSVGYSLIYWSDVVMAGSTVNTNVNPTQIDGNLVGDAAPSFPGWTNTQFWAQGITAGLDWRF